MDTRGSTLCLLATLVCFVNGTASWGQTYNPTASDPDLNTAGGTGALPSNRRHLCLALLVTLGFLLGGRPVAQADASFTFAPIDVPGASATAAAGINPSGQIVGVYSDSTGGNRGFLYDGGMFTLIDVPGVFFTAAFGINSRGQIVGGYSDVQEMPKHGFLYAGGVFTTIDVPGASDTRANGINSRGQIVGGYVDSTGTHGFLYDEGVFTTIDVPGTTFTVASGINSHGQIVGSYLDSAGVQHGFLATPKK